MNYDWQIFGAIVFLCFGVLNFLSAMIEKIWPTSSIVFICTGLFFIGWAFVLSDGNIIWEDIINSVYNIIGKAIRPH